MASMASDARSVASVAMEVAGDSQEAAAAAAAARSVATGPPRDMPWVSGWVSGHTPRPDTSAWPPVQAAYSADGVHLTPEAYAVLRREVSNIILTTCAASRRVAE